MNWYAVYTKPNAEDSAARLLNNAGIRTLNPKLKRKKYLRGKYTEVVEQLFPCYLFVLFDASKHSHMIRYTRGIRYIVGKGNPLVVHENIINAISARMKGDLVISIQEQFEKGERIMIKEGPFKDFYGIFERDIPGRERAMILLEALQCRFEVERVSLSKA